MQHLHLQFPSVQLPKSAGAAPRPASSKQNINFFIDSSFPEEDHPNKNDTSPTLQKFYGGVKGSSFLGLLVEGDDVLQRRAMKGPMKKGHAVKHAPYVVR